MLARFLRVSKTGVESSTGVDYAFKRLFGDPSNSDLLIDFLNAVLKPVSPIVEVEILNPFTEKEFSTDKLTVVDVKARLADGRRLQIEVQTSNPAALPERMLYSWTGIYKEQISEGDDYFKLRPVISIWILRRVLFKSPAKGSGQWGPHWRFQARDIDHGLLLSDHLDVHVLELPRFLPGGDLDALGRWLYFLKEARAWTSLPPVLETPVMRKAMKVLEQISEREREFWAYEARQRFIRDQETTRREIELNKAELEKLAADKEQLAADKERLVAALRELGVDPETVLKGTPPSKP